MTKAEELASIFRKSKKLIIEKLDNESYNITNTYVMVNLKGEEYMNFFDKYNSYITTMDIPLEFEGVISIDKGDDQFSEDSLDTRIITDKLDEANLEVESTPFYLNRGKKEEVKLMKLESKKLAIFDREYEYLLSLGNKYKIKNTESPLFVLNNEKIKAVIMPVKYICETSIRDKVKKLIA